MNLYRRGSGTSQPPESAFVGTVDIGGYFRRQAPSRLAGASVTFRPGARTPWKVNPLGQTIVITDGTGWVQAEHDDITEVHAGDFIWFGPGQRHWEGATPHAEMTCVAVQEEDSRSVQFWEAVSDDEYHRGPTAR